MAHISRELHVVRSYELDSYGHANNAAIVQWFEHGRNRLLQDNGFDYGNIEARWGVRFVLVSSKVDYKHSLRMGDRVELSATVTKLGRTSTTFAQQADLMAPDGTHTVAAVCESIIVWTDPGMTTPQPIPPEFRSLYG
ncbi:MAG: acyl-CoA thioesterase [Planctomycetes bacterium]|nr:acyl-CoA thioesterase [Planctomycetota bacterium]